MLLATTAATALAVASAAVAVGTLFAYLYSVRRAERNAAREEALALAETRGAIIIELQAALELLERRTRELQVALAAERAEAREQVYRMHRLYGVALIDLLACLRADLKAAPPDIAGALDRIRELLPNERPAA